MKITYLDTGEIKLISFHRHDFREHWNKNEDYFCIDGGQEDYIRWSAPEGYSPQEAEIEELFPVIRSTFYWTSNYDENMNRISPKTKLLKDLTTDHIDNILDYLDNYKGYEFTKEIMKAELKYRENE